MQLKPRRWSLHLFFLHPNSLCCCLRTPPVISSAMNHCYGFVTVLHFLHTRSQGAEKGCSSISGRTRHWYVSFTDEIREVRIVIEEVSLFPNIFSAKGSFMLPWDAGSYHLCNHIHIALPRLRWFILLSCRDFWLGVVLCAHFSSIQNYKTSIL